MHYPDRCACGHVAGHGGEHLPEEKRAEIERETGRDSRDHYRQDRERAAEHDVCPVAIGL